MMKEIHSGFLLRQFTHSALQASLIYGSSIILSNNLSNENINIRVSVVIKTKRELKWQNELFWKYHFSEITSLFVFIDEPICGTFDVIIDNP